MTKCYEGCMAVMALLDSVCTAAGLHDAVVGRFSCQESLGALRAADPSVQARPGSG